MIYFTQSLTLDNTLYEIMPHYQYRVRVIGTHTNTTVAYNIHIKLMLDKAMNDVIARGNHTSQINNEEHNILIMS